MIIKVEATIPCRLDKYLRRLYPKLTQGVIERALRQKQIMVNGNKIEANLRIKEDDEIFINDKLNLPQEETLEVIFSDSIITLANKLIKNYLIYENEHFIAINKPAGLATQGGTKINLSIDDALKYLNYKNSNGVKSAPFEYKAQGATPIDNRRATSNDVGEWGSFDYKLVHRLDKETSGLLIIAKNYESSVKLADAFKEKLIAKTYIAVVFGRPPKNIGEIQGLIGKRKEGAYEIVDIDNENGKLAITHYKLLKSLNNNLSLIEFTPITGRMHQLRFHAKLLNCPIVGDAKYGMAQPPLHPKHMLLHASNIVFHEKIFGEEITLKAKLPNYFLNILGSVNQI
ncbi:RluA family pseudouridine synthase [Rickettsia endosymbiont of Halotydeus destructor]|uniref:RluA family pseudouridine synthase n=1 Tax=Rickettsia endosymbiont of Halotydeus destructor TaxID=2996754 RepID=UPI003BAFAE8D